MKKQKVLLKFFTFLFSVLFVIQFSITVSAQESQALTTIATLEAEFDCKSAILMEASTGTILFEQNPDEALPPASVTKVMTLLLVMEAIEDGKLKLDDTVTASAHACSMGGSQIYLKEGEQMTVEDMVKSVVISSANDAAVALAEHIAGSEDEFIKNMNKRAKELGMKNTNFENTNGLDDTAKNHVTSARDIAIMSRELIKHKKITEYSSIWMDTIRNGEFGLTNTNRLVRFYKGATGLKTGSTSKAGFCISATATRNEMSLICVIMAAPTRDVRNQTATQILDWGFSNFSLYSNKGNVIDNIYVAGGKETKISASYPDFSCIIEKGDLGKIEYLIDIPKSLTAPVKENEKIGKIIYKTGEKELGHVDIIANKQIDKITFWSIFSKIICRIISK